MEPAPANPNHTPAASALSQPTRHAGRREQVAPIERRQCAVADRLRPLPATFAADVRNPDHRPGAQRRRCPRGLPGRRAARHRRPAPRHGGGAAALSVRRDMRHLGRCHQCRGAGLRRRPVRRHGGGARRRVAGHPCRAGVPGGFAGRDPQRRAMADDAVRRLAARALAQGAASFAAGQRPAGPAAGTHRAAAAAAAHALRPPRAGAGAERVELQRRHARHLLPVGRAGRALGALAARGGAGRTGRGAPAGLVGHSLRVPGQPSWASTDGGNGSATARCDRPRRCLRPSTWERSGCW